MRNIVGLPAACSDIHSEKVRVIKLSTLWNKHVPLINPGISSQNDRCDSAKPMPFITQFNPVSTTVIRPIQGIHALYCSSCVDDGRAVWLHWCTNCYLPCTGNSRKRRPRFSVVGRMDDTGVSADPKVTCFIRTSGYPLWGRDISKRRGGERRSGICGNVEG
jgi:hypothetical protein